MKPMAASDAKAIVDEIKAKVKSKKFYPGSHAEEHSVRFSAPRFPAEKAIEILGSGTDGKPDPRKFEGDEILHILRLKPDTLKAVLYRKPHRFSKRGATATRCGTAALKLLWMELSYNAGNLRGCLRCINAPPPEDVAFAAEMAGYSAGCLAKMSESERTEYLASMSNDETANLESLRAHPEYMAGMAKAESDMA